jgi:hypothetical protein
LARAHRHLFLPVFSRNAQLTNKPYKSVTIPPPGTLRPKISSVRPKGIA